MEYYGVALCPAGVVYRITPATMSSLGLALNGLLPLDLTVTHKLLPMLQENNNMPLTTVANNLNINSTAPINNPIWTDDHWTLPTPHAKSPNAGAWGSPVINNMTIDGLFNNLNTLANAAAILAPWTRNIPLPEEPSRVGTLVPRYTEDPQIGETILCQGPTAPYNPEPSDNSSNSSSHPYRCIRFNTCRRPQTNIITCRTNDITMLAHHHCLTKEYLQEALLPANPYEHSQLSHQNQLKAAKLFTIWNAIELFEEFENDAMGNLTYLSWRRRIIMDWMEETSEDWAYPCINCHLPHGPWCI